MSNTLAIGTVTAAIQSMLNAVNQPLPGDPNPDTDLADAYCTARSLDVARNHMDKKNQLNLFLFQVRESGSFRNMNLPSVHDGESGQQPLSLILSYILTAYGANDDDVLAHRMIGRAMLMLHDRPTLTRELLKSVVGGNDLWLQAERVRVKPLPMGPEEISKLWTGFGKPYRLSVGYEVSIVLIESTAPKIAQTPVLTRGPVRGTAPYQTDTGATVSPTLDSVYPSLDHFAGTVNRPAMRLGETVTLYGATLAASPLTVTFEHPLLATPNTVTINAAHPADHVDVPIPDDAVNWPAGIYSVTVTDPSGHTSNTLPVPLAPTITNITRAGLSVTLTVKPSIRTPDQKYAMIVQGQMILPDTEGGLAFTLASVPAGPDPTYVRLRVDGVDSILVADYTKSPPTFDPSQKLP